MTSSVPTWAVEAVVIAFGVYVVFAGVVAAARYERFLRDRHRRGGVVRYAPSSSLTDQPAPPDCSVESGRPRARRGAGRLESTLRVREEPWRE